MTRQHYGAVLGAIIGLVACRVASFAIVDLVGDLSNRDRFVGSLLGELFAGIPLVLLVGFVLFRLRCHGAELPPTAKAVGLVGWFMAGGVVGLLPYSRGATAIHLRLVETVRAPGFLHGMDVTIMVGFGVTVALLLISLGRRPHPEDRIMERLEAEFRDDRPA